jgi:glutathionylspermidine synthase
MQEYLDALNRQEVAQQELDSMKEKYKHMYASFNGTAETDKTDEKHLQELRFEQEKLLGEIFNDSYGSDKEWKLEMEMDLMGEKKGRIQGAHYKWSNAHKFLSTAVSQVNWAAKRWAQIMTHNIQAQMVIF